MRAETRCRKHRKAYRKFVYEVDGDLEATLMLTDSRVVSQNCYSRLFFFFLVFALVPYGSV